MQVNCVVPRIRPPPPELSRLYERRALKKSGPDGTLKLSETAVPSLPTDPSALSPPCPPWEREIQPFCSHLNPKTPQQNPGPAWSAQTCPALPLRSRGLGRTRSRPRRCPLPERVALSFPSAGCRDRVRTSVPEPETRPGLGLEVGAPRQGLWPRSAAESEGSESLARFPNEEMQLGKAQQLGHPNLLSKVYKVSVLD